MKKSCGIIVILNQKILLCHPTNSKWESTYGVPKGKVNIGEEEIDCAVREFREETGITIDKNKLSVTTRILYNNYQTGETYKELCLFVHRINELSEIGLDNEIVPKSQLQIEEIDWCGFLNKEEATKRMFPKQISVLDFL